MFRASILYVSSLTSSKGSPYAVLILSVPRRAALSLYNNGVRWRCADTHVAPETA